MSRIDNSSSVICPSEKLRTEFTSPIAKCTSTGLLDRTLFAANSTCLIRTLSALINDGLFIKPTRILASWISHLLLLRTLSGKLTAFSLSYLNELFIAQIFYLIYNICERKLWKQAMRPVLITLHQKLEITCLRKRKLSETSSQLKLHAILRCEN